MDLQHLLDRSAIDTLVASLGRCLDERDFDGLRALFTPDAEVVTPGGTSRGHDALVEQARRRHTAPRGVQHVITNLLVDFAGGAAGSADPRPERAAVRANLLVAFADDGPSDPAPFVLGEVYRFGIVRTDAGWRFDRMSSAAVWTLNRPAALTLNR